MTTRHDSASGSSATAERTVTSAGQALSQGVRVDEVRERPLAVHLHDRNALAVARLQLGIEADVDELEIEAKLGPQGRHDLEGALAERAVFSVEDPDRRYG